EARRTAASDRAGTRLPQRERGRDARRGVPPGRGAGRRARHLDGGPEGDIRGVLHRALRPRNEGPLHPDVLPVRRAGRRRGRALSVLRRQRVPQVQALGLARARRLRRRPSQGPRGLRRGSRAIHGIRLRAGARPAGAPSLRVPGPAPPSRRGRALSLTVREGSVKFSLEWIADFVDTSAASGPAGVRALLDRAGFPVESVEGEDWRTILDVEITPNRPDAMSHRGLAREIAAMAGLQFPSPSAAGGGQGEVGAPVESLTSITIEVPRLCRRFGGRVVSSISGAPAPERVR